MSEELLTDWNDARLEAALEEIVTGETIPPLRLPDLRAPFRSNRNLRAILGNVLRRPLVAAALVLIVAAAVALIFDPGRPPHEDDDAALEAGGQVWPLEAGARYVYRLRRGADTSVVEQELRGSSLFFPQPERGARQVHLIVETEGTSRRFEYVGAEHDGLHRYLGLEGPERPGLAEKDPGMLLLPLPAGSQREWVAREPQSDSERAWRGRIVDPKVDVSTPAGTFRALHLQLREVGDRGVRSEDIWFVPGTGIVRREIRRGEERLESRELLSRSRGPRPISPGDALTDYLHAHGEAGGRLPEVAWIHLPLRRYLPVTHFARLRTGPGRESLFAIRGTDVWSVDPEDGASLQQILEREGIDDWRSPPLDRERMAVAAELGCRLLLAREGRIKNLEVPEIDLVFGDDGSCRAGPAPGAIDGVAGSRIRVTTDAEGRIHAGRDP